MSPNDRATALFVVDVVVQTTHTSTIAVAPSSTSASRFQGKVSSLMVVAFGVAIAVLSSLYAVQRGFPIQETNFSPTYETNLPSFSERNQAPDIYGLPLTPSALRRMADGETIHVNVQRKGNQNISSIFQVRAEDLQLSREELLVMSRQMEGTSNGWGSAVS